MSISFALPPAAQPGQAADTIDTPSLVLDLDTFSRNVDRMQAAADHAGVKLRPHAKAHKCPDISLVQIARGAVGICCQKVSEAVPFVRAGVRDIHISNEVAARPRPRWWPNWPGTRASAYVSTMWRRWTPRRRHADGRHATGRFRRNQCRTGPLRRSRTARRAGTGGAHRAHPQLTMRGLQAYHGGIQHLRGWPSVAMARHVLRTVPAR
jgi:D-serine deaminase-like pyridoxal phosphate-dependent protein